MVEEGALAPVSKPPPGNRSKLSDGSVHIPVKQGVLSTSLSVARPDGSARPVTGSSTGVLRGFTVFYDVGDWQDGWDQVQLAPLTVTTSNGRSVGVRERSWTG